MKRPQEARRGQWVLCTRHVKRQRGVQSFSDHCLSSHVASAHDRGARRLGPARGTKRQPLHRPRLDTCFGLGNFKKSQHKRPRLLNTKEPAKQNSHHEGPRAHSLPEHLETAVPTVHTPCLCVALRGVLGIRAHASCTNAHQQLQMLGLCSTSLLSNAHNYLEKALNFHKRSVSQARTASLPHCTASCDGGVVAHTQLARAHFEQSEAASGRVWWSSRGAQIRW